MGVYAPLTVRYNARMTSRESFIRAICETPGDDSVRSIYADYLEEQGETARAEFIRVQVELAQRPREYEVWVNRQPFRDFSVVGVLAQAQAYRFSLPLGQFYHQSDIQAVERKSLLRRERELLDKHRRSWVMQGCPDDWEYWQSSTWLQQQPGQQGWAVLSSVGTLGGVAVEFRRGFIAAIALATADFLTHAEALFRAQPIEAVRLTDKRPTGHLHLGTGQMWVKRLAAGDVCSATLPETIFDLLDSPNLDEWAHFGDISDMKLFTDFAAAQQALSDACVALGRQRAGLPALPLWAYVPR